ncbi:MAG: hypothetical protein AAF799_00250 [Myxococcota bacterium]
MRHAGRVAYGTPAVCPDDAVDPMGDGTPGPMDFRCSYGDTTGGAITQIRGRVSIEGGPGSTGASPGRVEVEVFEAPTAIGGPLGRKVAHGTTDPQGTFSVGATIREGQYVLVVPGDGPRPRAERTIDVGGDFGHRLDDVQLVIPRPMDEPN